MFFVLMVVKIFLALGGDEMITAKMKVMNQLSFHIAVVSGGTKS